MINPDRLTVKASEAVNAAVDHARRAGNPVVYDLHLLLALLEQDEGIVAPILHKLGLGVTRADLLEGLRAVRGGHRVTDQTPENQYQALQRYTRDLTEAARKGKLDPVIGRDEEIRRVIQVLSRRTKN